MRMVVAAVGTPRNRELAAAIHDYETRAARYWPLEVREVREEPARTASPDTVRDRDARDLAFAIGGAYGLSDGVRGRATTSLAFARWTMSHELARLVLAEQ